MTNDLFKTLRGQRVLVVGGSSGIGLATAAAALQLEADVTIASRSQPKIDAACAKLGSAVQGVVLDTGDEASVERIFAEATPFDHVVVTAAQVRMAPVRELPMDQAMAVMNSKFWGAYRVARAASINKEGSLTLVSGFLAQRPRKGAALVGAVNAGLDGLARGLALELAPVRVNAVSPGLVKTPIYDGMPDAARQAMFDAAAERLPVGHVGLPEHLALQIIACLLNPYMTGSVIYVDGGGLLA